MKLTDLNPFFLRHERRIEPGLVRMPDGSTQEIVGPHDYMIHVDSLIEAQGIWFNCPLCTARNGGPVGTHGVICFFPDRGVPDDIGLNNDGKPVRWTASGSTFADLTLRPSTLIQGGCGWHGFVTTGEVTNA